MQQAHTQCPEFFPSGWARNSHAVGYNIYRQTNDQGVWVVNRDGSGGQPGRLVALVEIPDLGGGHCGYDTRLATAD
jgi:hypothetical protein